MRFLLRSGAAGVAQWIALAIALGALVAAVISLTTESVPAELRIGVAQPLSGNLSHQGQDMLHGVQFAVENVNQRGGMLIRGQRVRLSVVSGDDASDAETGKVVAQRLVDQDKAKLLERLKTFEGIAPVTGFMRFDARGEQHYGVVSVYRLHRGAWELESRSDQW